LADLVSLADATCLADLARLVRFIGFAIAQA
jgi:hypothetical protein